MSEILVYSPITHAHIKPVMHPRLKTEINSRTAVKYLRFLHRVIIDRLELPLHVYGRWVPEVPIHPAHLIVSTLNPSTYTWDVLKEVDFEPDPRIWGEGLSQEMSVVEMNAHFQKILNERAALRVDLEGVKTELLRVECDREHPVWPNHGETNGNVFHVPFGVLDPLQVYGEHLELENPWPEVMPILRSGRIEPVALRGATWRKWGESILFESQSLSVGFSLRRPILLHLGWDALGEGLSRNNRLSTRRVKFEEANRGVSGPLLVTCQGDYGSHRWTGEVEILGNQVFYRGLHSVPELSIDATFHVEPDRLILELVQRSDREFPALEAEAWRLVWDLSRGMTGVAAVPTLKPGRSGDVQVPALFAGDGVGCLGCRILEGDPDLVHLQVESYRPSSEVAAGFVLGKRPGNVAYMVVPAGEVRATIELAVDNLQPIDNGCTSRPGTGVRRHWASTFSCYRPEWGGFSNHAASVNCHVNQHGQIEVAAFTKKTRSGFDPLDLARFTVARALMDGSGYGYWRNLYLDSDPVLISAAGRIFQVKPDLPWLRAVEPGLVEAVGRILGTIGEEGLAICRDLSGNSGSYRWSSNAWDIVGFGHMDAYVNAWSYRALRNAAALLGESGQIKLANRCREAAGNLKANYARYLVNPETGWVIGWRSRDGQIHDYAYLWINGIACAFGVLEPDIARQALLNLETLRDRLGLKSARLGLPFNLLPLLPEDHLLPKVINYRGTVPTFEMYTDGSMSPSAITYYLRALSIHGLKDRSKAMANDLDAGFADGLFTVGAGTDYGRGSEYLSWEGLAAGYEGTFGPTMGAMYAIAIEQGLFSPPEPEWWPAD